MAWKTWFARDSFLWCVMFYGGLVFLAAVQIIDGSYRDYGISDVAWRWITLLAGVVTLVGGKMGLSLAPKKSELG
jgi:hypothetical protein